MDTPARKTSWFLFAKDSHSNEVIASALQRGQVDSEFSLTECADGVKRHLYKVPDYATAARFWRSQKDLKASFEIFRSQSDGIPGKWEFPTKKKITPEEIRATSSAIKLSATMSMHRKH